MCIGGQPDVHGAAAIEAADRSSGGFNLGEGAFMTFKQTLLNSLAGSAMLVAAAGQAAAHDAVIVQNKTKPGADGFAAKFAVIERLTPNVHPVKKPALAPTWVFSYTYSGKTYNETFVGTTVTGGASTTVPVYIIPIKMVYQTTSYDPTVVTANGVSIIQNVVNSPVFASSVDFKSGSVDLGTTQYLDAFQRGTLWGTVSAHTGYHVLLGTPTIEPVQTVTIPKRNGALINAFGATNLIMANINTFDADIQPMIASLKIPSTALPLFITTQTYLSSGNSTSTCCIGGYHSISNSLSQPYAYSTYITTSGAFAQNVGALSHEIGEWIDDPNVNNKVPSACGSGAVLEVGDPLEGNTNYGDYAYTAGGVTWDLQDLVYLPYFGAPTSTSANGYSTFQGETIGVCSKGG
jgi:hypothetical protein